MEPVLGLEPLLRGDPVEAMETAKQIIGRELVVDPAALETILENKDSQKWARIASIYSLGLLGERSAVPALIRILSNSHEPIAVRAHAAEALGNIGDPESVPALAEMLRDETSPSLRRSCAYALGEIDGSEARAALDAARLPRQSSKRTRR